MKQRNSSISNMIQDTQESENIQLLKEQKDENNSKDFFKYYFKKTKYRLIDILLQSYGLIKGGSKYLIADTKKHPRHFLIWITSIIFVIFFVGILAIASEFSPLVFLRISETIAGESDMQMHPKPSIFIQREPTIEEQFFVNYTRIDQEFCQKSQRTLKGCSPRWFLPITMYSNKSQNKTASFNSNQKEYDTMTQKTLGAYLFIVDEAKEKQIGLGKHLDLKNIKKGEAILSKNAKNFLNMKNQKDDAVFSIELTQLLLQKLKFQEQSNKTQALEDLLSEQLLQYFDENQQYVQYFKEQQGAEGMLFQLNIDKDNEEWQQKIQKISKFILSMPQNFTIPVVQYVENYEGKWPSTIGHVLMIDSSSVEYLIDKNIDEIMLKMVQNVYGDDGKSFWGDSYFSGIISQKIRQEWDISTNFFNQYAFAVEAVFNNRSKVYHWNTKSYKAYTSNLLVQHLGTLSNVYPRYQLIEQYNEAIQNQPFINSLFDSAIILLLIICAFLIYSMSLSDIENKVTELSIFRILGLKRVSVIIMLLLKGLYYSIPAFSIGILISHLFKVFVSHKILEEYSYTYDADLSSDFIQNAFLLGIIMPIISSIIPARRSLDQNLRDSLDPHKRFNVGLSVTVQKLEKLGLSFYQCAISILLIFIGQLCYTFIPRAFIKNDRVQFLQMVNITLMIFIYGIVTILSFIQPYLQKFLIYIYCGVIFKKQNKRLLNLIYNNFESHKRKLSKISFIYILAFSFMVFISIGLNLQEQIVINAIIKNVGADMTAEIKGEDVSLDEYGIRNFVKQHQDRFPDKIEDIAFISTGLEEFPGIGSMKIMNGNTGEPSVAAVIKTVSPNFLEVIKNKNYIPSINSKEIEFSMLNSDPSKVNGLDGLYVYQDIKKRGGNAESRGKYDPNDTLKTFDESFVISNSENHQFVFDRIAFLTKTRSESLYMENEQVVNSIMSSNLMYYLGLEVDQEFSMKVQRKKSEPLVIFRGKVIHSIDYVPAENSFSPNLKKAKGAEMFVSQEQFIYLRDQIWEKSTQEVQTRKEKYMEKMPLNTTFEVPQEKVFFKFKYPLSEKDRVEIADGLKYYLKHEVLVYDVQALQEGVHSGIIALKEFMGLIGFIVMLLGFFLILTLFNSAINESLGELKIMRAVGLNFKQIQKVYIYESIAVVLSSGLLGLILGTVITVTLTLEVSMLIEIQMDGIELNWENPIILMITGLISGFLGAWISLSPLRNKQISEIDKLKNS